MKIAIIGGGAAGMASTWYLGKRHQVPVFECQAILGGNIRTLGHNVPCAGLPAGVTLDAGVVEFSRENFPRFHALMDELDVGLHDGRGRTARCRAAPAQIPAYGERLVMGSWPLSSPYRQPFLEDLLHIKMTPVVRRSGHAMGGNHHAKAPGEVLAVLAGE